MRETVSNVLHHLLANVLLAWQMKSFPLNSDPKHVFYSAGAPG